MAKDYDFEKDELCYKINQDSATVSVNSCTKRLAGDIVIPESVSHEGKVFLVNEIGIKAFEKCNCLSSIYIPHSVSEIGSGAFAGCSNLNSVTIPDSVTVIDEGTFAGCNCLTEIVLPNSVTVIGMGAFAGCCSLTTIYIPDSVTKIDNYAFCRCIGLESVIIPDSVLFIVGAAFGWCTNLTSIIIGKSLKEIDSDAFDNCANLRNIYCKSTELTDYRCLDDFRYKDNNYDDEDNYYHDMFLLPSNATTLYILQGSLEAYKTLGFDENQLVELTDEEMERRIAELKGQKI